MKVAHAVAAACAPIGAWFTVATLGTGMLWGKPMWGTYWVWDPRLTSELVLLFLYFGYMGLRAGIDDPQKADKASAVLAIVGVVNVPDHSLLGGLVELAASAGDRHAARRARHGLADAVAAAADAARLLRCISAAVLLVRLRAELLRRERNASWMREVVDMSEFFAMGGYGKYVWPAFAHRLRHRGAQSRASP